MSNYSSEGEEETSNISDQTYVKPAAIARGGAASNLPRNTVPPWLTMVQEAVVKLSEGLGRGAVSRIKIADYIKLTYGLQDVSSVQYFKKALKVAVEKGIIESTSANAQSFKLTKVFKEKQRKSLAKKESSSKLKKDKPVKGTEEKEESEPPSKSSTKKSATSTKSAGKKVQKIIEEDEKKNARKPLTGEETKRERKTKANEKLTVSTSEKKILKEKINTMKKATNIGLLKLAKPVVEEEPDDLSTPEEEPEPEPEPTTKRKRGRKATAK